MQCMLICLPERHADGCYGGYLLLDCGDNTDRRRIHVIRETYGRHPKDKCSPSPGTTDCAVEGSFYRNMCEGNVTCRYLGVPWVLIDTPECPDVYTNYVRVVYRCVAGGATGKPHVRKCLVSNKLSWKKPLGVSRGSPGLHL